MRVLFVCSGNICRSPVAAELLRHRASLAGLDDLVVDSAGTLGIEGAPASPEAVEVLVELGLDLSGHRSKGVTRAALAGSDLVVVMEQRHRVELALRFPLNDTPVVLLRAFERAPEIDPAAPDLEDPIGRPTEFYRTQLTVVLACIENLTSRLAQRG